MKITKRRLQELAAINNPFLREAANPAAEAASELLSLLAHPDFIKYKDQLSDMIEDADFVKIDKLYTALYTEIKRHEHWSYK